RAILDWEMAHLGDPLEDLAWGLNPVWRFGTDDRAGGLVPREEAVRIWEAESGLRADPAALHWWEVFSSVKGQAIWVSSGREFTDGKNQDPVLALAAWLMGNSQDRAILSLLGQLS
ncbi:MAG: phosphotransferase, partial [Myxococcota bacterium]